MLMNSVQFILDALPLYENNEALTSRSFSRARSQSFLTFETSCRKRYGLVKGACSKAMRDAVQVTANSDRDPSVRKIEREVFCLEIRVRNPIPVCYDHRSEYSVHTDVHVLKLNRPSSCKWLNTRENAGRRCVLGRFVCKNQYHLR